MGNPLTFLGHFNEQHIFVSLDDCPENVSKPSNFGLLIRFDAVLINTGKPFCKSVST